MKNVLKLYKKYEYLAYLYSYKLFYIERLGYEKADLVQELKLKVYTSILMYLKKWKYYKKTGLVKPVPLKFYIKTALVNKIKDLIGSIKREVVITDLEGFDVGTESEFDLSNVELKERVAVVYNVDILEGLNIVEKECFCRYLRGAEVEEIASVFKNNIDADLVIRKHLEWLQAEYKDTIVNNKRFFVNYNS